jgi:ADP-ribosyl-[dinitrogen reductase] hydrolase
MRLAPAAIRHWQAPDLMVDVARRQSLTTHGAPQAVEVCMRFSKVLSLLMDQESVVFFVSEITL